MNCVIYKGARRPDTYLYIEREDDFSRVPGPLLDLLGKLELVMHLELTPERNLAQADPAQVCQQLTENGFYLQFPPDESAWTQ